MAQRQRPTFNDAVVMRGARTNNLRGIDIDIPKRKLVVFAGVSGSGKSSLVFDTIAAESQRLLTETYPAYLRLYAKTSCAAIAKTWQAVQRAIDTADKPCSKEQATVPAPPAGSTVPDAQPSPNDNALSVFFAVHCNDSTISSDVGDYQRAVAEDREKYPVFGAGAANIVPCAFWNYEPSEAPVEINDDRPRNILILQNERPGHATARWPDIAREVRRPLTVGDRRHQRPRRLRRRSQHLRRRRRHQILGKRPDAEEGLALLGIR